MLGAVAVLGVAAMISGMFRTHKIFTGVVTLMCIVGVQAGFAPGGNQFLGAALVIVGLMFGIITFMNK